MPNFASPADTATHGEYTIKRTPGDTRPIYRFTGRISNDGSTPYPAVADRYHVYSGWFCPWAQRVTLVIELAGLSDTVSVSYVDGKRDARGWAFRETHGPDPVNGFTLLREAYDLTEPDFDGHVSVPTLWDRETNKVISNDFATIDADLASQYDVAANGGVELYPADLRAQIDELETWLRADVNSTAHTAIGEGPVAAEAARTLQAAFVKLGHRLRDSRFLLGDEVTLADVRLFVTLVRYDASAARAGAPRLAEFGELWRYARDLYAIDAFTKTTDFSSFGGDKSVVADWQSSVGVAR
ncbi:glutathione S-transferase C-terminal domain-containing protein [Williamsia muralis]|uniref:Glutathione S-transferase n=1 Tax=Williamsia marianensis TaxID=85044 RepID=A0A2G3PGE0_WILMA|nr:glutathione S-transferase C-terminal domain-containing protein [Williamsia marianensis]PHV64877.1 glutathione S-transferase [Williamsia marianensis]